MTDITVRNRRLKTILEQAFGRGKVSVQSGRGTACMWVYVKIAYTPRNHVEYAELRIKIDQLITTAGIELAHYYPDDGTDAKHPCLNIKFERRYGALA